jgi:hypothetical protein
MGYHTITSGIGSSIDIWKWIFNNQKDWKFIKHKDWHLIIFIIIFTTTYNHYIVTQLCYKLTQLLAQLFLDEIGVQVDIQIKKGSNVIYSAIPESREWLTINCVINIVGGVLLWFYIFKGEKLHYDYIKLYKAGICISMQKIV